MGELLRISRGRLGLTQKQAADVLLVAESTYGSYERCERIPPIDFLRDADRGLDARGAIIACIEMMEEEKYPPEFVSWVRMERKALDDQRVREHADSRDCSRPRRTRRPCTRRGDRRTPRRRSSVSSPLDWNGRRC